MQKFSLAQIILVGFVISLIACDGEKETTQPIPTPLPATYNAPFSESVAPKPSTYQVPKGVNCDTIFKKNAAEIMSKDKANLYVGEEALTYVNNEKEIGMIVLPFYRSGGFGFMVKLIHNSKIVCIENTAPFGFRFADNNKIAYGLDGKHKSNCMKGGNTPNDFAMGLYDFPINSIAFKMAVEKDLEFVAIQADIGFLPAAPTNETTGAFLFKNMMRCVYDAIGSGVDLSNDSLLINNRLSK